MEYDNNLLYCNNCFYKCKNSGNNIDYINIYDIIKELSLNYFITIKFQTLLINQIMDNKIGKKYAKTIFFPNQI